MVVFLPWVSRERFSSSRLGWQGEAESTESTGSPRNDKKRRIRRSWSSGEDRQIRDGPMSSNSTYSWRETERWGSQTKWSHLFSGLMLTICKWLPNIPHKQRHFKPVPVCPGPRSPLLTDPWLYQASMAASDLLRETTPHATRLSLWAGSGPSPPPRPLPRPLPPLWTHRNVILAHRSI